MKQVSADKAYSSKMIHRIIQSMGAMPYIPFKDNVKQISKDAPEIWNKCFIHFSENQEEWKKIITSVLMLKQFLQWSK